MRSRPPLVVAILYAEGGDIDYELYTQAYGLEMQIDDDWNAEAVLLAPHDHLAAVTENTGVTGEDTRIVSAGVTDVPLLADGSPNLATIAVPQNNWLLVGDPRLKDSDELIQRKSRAALDLDCQVVLCITRKDAVELKAKLGGLAGSDCSTVVVALINRDALVPNIAIETAQLVRSYLTALGCSGSPRFIVAGNVSAENAPAIVALNGVDGVLLLPYDYDSEGGPILSFSTILEVLEALGG